MKKDLFEKPIVEVIEFASESILTDSNTGGNAPIEGEEDEL